MADMSCDGEHRAAEEMDKLLYTDIKHNSEESELDSPPLKLDHCDLLLDAIDAQLGQMQLQPNKHQGISRDFDGIDAAPLTWSQSLSKDTGLGSTTKTNDTPMSFLDLRLTPTMEQLSERSTGCGEEGLVILAETNHKFDKRTRDEREKESEREQVIWRLEKLLGDTCTEGEIAGGGSPPSDSICTEDFVTRFRDEMVELGLPQSDTQQPSREERRKEISDTFYSEQKRNSALNVDRRERAKTGRSIRDTETAHYSQADKMCERKELEKCLSDSSGIKTPCNEKADVGERRRTPRRLGADNSIAYRSDVVREQETRWQNDSRPSKARFLAGVPVQSFDSVSIDSDLDSICTERVRQHIHKQPGLRSILQSVTDMDDISNQSDCNTATQDDCKTCSSSGQRSSDENAQNTSARKVPHNKRAAYRRVCSLDDKDTDEEMSQWSRKGRPERMSEKMQSDWAKMKERLNTLRQTCQKEEETVQLKKTQKRDVELCLSELQQKRKHALQDLEHLTKDIKRLEKEKSMLESALRDKRMEKDSTSCQLLELQRKRESCIREPSMVISVLQRDEMDRQLDAAKTQLFAEQRRSREKLETMQEKLEETLEELQRITEAERILRVRCAFLEEKQQQKKDQMETKLGECQIRVGTLEQMLAQRELQLLDLKERHGVLKAERDGLMGELQHLKNVHCNALKEAQEQAQRQMLQVEQVRKLRVSVEQQKADMKNREEELRVEAMKKVHEAVEVAKGKWEAEKEEAVQIQCGILEEQNKKTLESMQSELQQEQSKRVALQRDVMELKKKVQELKSERSVQQREQQSLLAVVCKSQKEEHQAKLQEMQRQMESRRAAQRLQQAVQLAEEEADRLRFKLEEKESNHREITAELEQQLRLCAQELKAECQQLLILVEPNGGKHCEQMPHSATVTEALTSLRTLTEQVKNIMSHLQQELDSQKQTTEQVRKDKERDLSIQRQQMRMERDQALEFLKERLIQEHIEELSSLNLAHVYDGGTAASLRKQLQAKDLELRQVQRSMAHWKEQTAARLACKFEEELTAELERCKTKLLRGRKTPKKVEEIQRKPDRRQDGQIPAAKDGQNTVCSPSLSVAASHSPSDVASLKLLCYLQSRVTQLREENRIYTSTPLSLKKAPLDLSGSQLLTITQDVSRIQGHSSNRTVSS